MEENKESDKILLPHHEQQALCSTRLPYRQGRKLTAVKVYSITKESNHLLVFGVPSLNLRQETKALFFKFGKLLQFYITKEHASEPFTETYYAQYENIQPARMAKRMIDTKNFYGGILHVCYAPEFETVEETRKKLVQRQRDVVFRLKNLEKDVKVEPQVPKKCVSNNIVEKEPKKLNMGQINTISIKDEIKVISKKKFFKNFKPYGDKKSINVKRKKSNLDTNEKETGSNLIGETSNDIDIVDCTNVETEVITNLNEALNYNKFGTEVIKKIPAKPLNKIQYHLN